MTWIADVPDRVDLVRLAIRADNGGQFYRRLLLHLLNHGFLNPAQEEGAWNARNRVLRAEELRCKTQGQYARHSGPRRFASQRPAP
jgi:hypothetical protein